MVETPSLPLIDAVRLRQAVAWQDLIEPVAAALRDSSAGRADNGLIVMYPAERADRGDVYVKTGVLQGHRIFIVKVSPWFARNSELGLPQGGFIGVFDAQTGYALAILRDEHYLSDIRTAATGAIAARILCPPVIERVTVLGAGTQAHWQVLALHHERPFRQLTVWSRNPDRARGLCSRLEPLLTGVALSTASGLPAAVGSADVIITATISREPLIRGDWLRAGQHITAVGADDPSKCELDADSLRRARVFVDSMAAARANGDVSRAIQAGQYSVEEIAGELGEVLAGSKMGRVARSDITIAKLVGIGAQDVAAAQVALARLGLLSESAPSADR
ncbi:MAG TPA: ornithine cyclodeaminase family protein [Steroidobacteraceae bacterium]|nr:ornithine cyclodeaminase family protein [Steroidobacteraceae bacterium]